MVSILRDPANAMDDSHSLIKVLNGKIIYLVKTTDLLNSKLTQVINSIHVISGAFSGWTEQFNPFAKAEYCHFNMQQEFVALYSMEINKPLISFLRLTEVDDLLRQISHLAQRSVIGFSDLPRFLTEEIVLKLSSHPTLQPAIDSLRNGFSLLMNPLVDIQFPSAKQLQLHLLFNLPVLSTTRAVGTIQQLVPITYRINKHCYSGMIPRLDLLLLICEDKMYFVQNTELSHCTQNSETILCSHDLLATVDSPIWLGEKWSPHTKLPFNHAHLSLPGCENLRPLIHLGSHFYLGTDATKLTVHHSNGTSSLFVSPLHV